MVYFGLQVHVSGSPPRRTGQEAATLRDEFRTERKQYNQNGLKCLLSSCVPAPC